MVLLGHLVVIFVGSSEPPLESDAYLASDCGRSFSDFKEGDEAGFYLSPDFLFRLPPAPDWSQMFLGLRSERLNNQSVGGLHGIRTAFASCSPVDRFFHIRLLFHHLYREPG